MQALQAVTLQGEWGSFQLESLPGRDCGCRPSRTRRGSDSDAMSFRAATARKLIASDEKSLPYGGSFMGIRARPEKHAPGAYAARPRNDVGTCEGHTAHAPPLGRTATV